MPRATCFRALEVLAGVGPACCFGHYVVDLRRRPIHSRPPVNPAQHWVADTTRIRQELEYREPVAPDEAIRRTIEWMRANPPVSTTDSGTSKQPFDGTGVL